MNLYELEEIQDEYETTDIEVDPEVQLEVDVFMRTVERSCSIPLNYEIEDGFEE